MRVWSSLLSCESPAAPKPPGFHKTARGPKRGHLRVPALQTSPKFQEKTPIETQKERKWGRKRETKVRNFGWCGGGAVRERRGPAWEGPVEGRREGHNTQQQQHNKQLKKQTTQKNNTNTNTNTNNNPHQHQRQHNNNTKNGLAKNGLAKIGQTTEH